MAKEKKVASKKATKKVTPITEAPTEAVAIVEDFLTREEQLMLEDASSSAHKATLAVQVEEGKVTNASLEKQILMSKHEKEVQEANQKIALAQNALNVKKIEAQQRAKRAGDIIISIKNKYGIQGDLQYDHVSGKISKPLSDI